MASMLFHELLVRLRVERFDVGPDQYLRLQQVLPLLIDVPPAE